MTLKFLECKGQSINKFPYKFNSNVVEKLKNDKLNIHLFCKTAQLQNCGDENN